MNILEAEDTIKGLPDDYLFNEAQYPSGKLPQFLVVSEIQRRQDMRQRYQANAKQPEGTVKDQILMGAQQGAQQAPQAAQQAPQAMPQQPMPQGIPQTIQPSGTAYMASGGIAPGGTVYMADGGRVPERDSGWWRNYIERPEPRPAPRISPKLWIAPSDQEDLEREIGATGGGLEDTAPFRALGLADFLSVDDEFPTNIHRYRDARRRVEESDQRLLNTINAARQEHRNKLANQANINEVTDTLLTGTPTDAQLALVRGRPAYGNVEGVSPLRPDFQTGTTPTDTGATPTDVGGGIASLFNYEDMAKPSQKEKAYEEYMSKMLEEGLPEPVDISSYKDAALKRSEEAVANARQMALAETLTNLGAGVMRGDPASGLSDASKAALAALRGGREESITERRSAEQIALQQANQERQQKIEEMGFKEKGLGALAKGERERINSAVETALKLKYYEIQDGYIKAQTAGKGTQYQKAFQQLLADAREFVAAENKSRAEAIPPKPQMTKDEMTQRTLEVMSAWLPSVVNLYGGDGGVMWNEIGSGR